MRWDEVLDREITAERLKERDTACCVHKDGAGCVQSPKTECSKIGDPVTNSVSGKSPKSKWVRILKSFLLSNYAQFYTLTLIKISIFNLITF